MNGLAANRPSSGIGRLEYHVVHVVLESLRADNFNHDHRQSRRVGRRVYDQQCGRGKLHDCRQQSNVLTSCGHLLLAAGRDYIGHDAGCDHLLHDGWIVPVDFLAVMFKSVQSNSRSYDNNQSDGCREWNLAERHIGRRLYDCGKHPNVRACIWILLGAAVSHHLGYHERRDDLLHDERIDSNNVIGVVLESVRNHAVDDHNCQGYRRR